MSARRYPILFASLGNRANQLPAEIAKPLETTLAANPASNGIALLDSLQRIREVEAADGQPLQRNKRNAGQSIALARIDRANAGLTVLLEFLHATPVSACAWMAKKRSRWTTTCASACCWRAVGCLNMWTSRCRWPELFRRAMPGGMHLSRECGDQS
jgi:hypothetical protein